MFLRCSVVTVFFRSTLFLVLFPTFLISMLASANSEDALKALQGGQLSTSELDDIWNKEIAPLSSHYSPQEGPQQLYNAFARQVEGLINDPHSLDATYEWIVAAISRMEADQFIWGRLMNELVVKYKGNEIDPILTALQATHGGNRSVPILRLIVQNGQQTQGKAKQISDLLSDASETPAREILGSLAEHYIGPAQDIFEIAKGYLSSSPPNSATALAIYSGLLKNQLLRTQSYPVIVSSIDETMKDSERMTEVKVRFLKNLITYYVAGNSDKLLEDILAMGDVIVDPDRRLEALKDVYRALVIKTRYCAQRGAMAGAEDLKAICGKLRDKYPRINEND